MPRLLKLARSGKKGVLEKTSAQSNQPATTKETTGAKFLGLLGIKSASRRPSPRPSSSATLPGQSEQRKPGNTPLDHGEAATVATETGHRPEVSTGPPTLAPEERKVMLQLSADQIRLTRPNE